MINFAIIVEFGGHNTSWCQSRHYTSVAQIVIPGYPHYMTQRGNRRQKTLFCGDGFGPFGSHLRIDNA